jgi:hypothetical protein
MVNMVKLVHLVHMVYMVNKISVTILGDWSAVLFKTRAVLFKTCATIKYDEVHHSSLV